MSDTVIGALSSLLGVIVGSFLTFVFSRKLLKQSTELQKAYEFVTEYYHPLRSALEAVSIYGLVWEDIIENEQAIGRNETKELYDTSKTMLCNVLTRFIESGAVLIIRQIDYQLYKDIFALKYHLDRYSELSDTERSRDGVVANIPPPDLVVKVAKRLSSLDADALIKGYQTAFRTA